METDTLMAEASFSIRIENLHQEKTAKPSIGKREKQRCETIYGKKYKDSPLEGSSPEMTEMAGGSTSAIRQKIQTVGNTPASSVKELFDIAFQYEFIKYSTLVAQRILFYGGKNLPGTVKRKKSPSVSGDIHDITCNFSP